jgi:hypothetical protein
MQPFIILVRFPVKLVPKTPYELWNGREPSLNYLRVWGYLVEAEVFNLSTGKIDPKIDSYHFIGYTGKSKDYHFYYYSRHTKVVKRDTLSFWRMRRWLGVAWYLERLPLSLSSQC